MRIVSCALPLQSLHLRALSPFAATLCSTQVVEISFSSAFVYFTGQDPRDYIYTLTTSYPCIWLYRYVNDIEPPESCTMTSKDIMLVAKNMQQVLRSLFATHTTSELKQSFQSASPSSRTNTKLTQIQCTHTIDTPTIHDQVFPHVFQEQHRVFPPSPGLPRLSLDKRRQPYGKLDSGRVTLPLGAYDGGLSGRAGL